MQADDITKTIVEYVQNHRSPPSALIPERMPQGILDILLEDSKNQANLALSGKPVAGKYITTAVLLLLSIQKNSGHVEVTENDLSQSISRFTQHLYLESLSRRGLIRDLQPELTLENILDPQLTPKFTITELGKQAFQEAQSPLPDYLMDSANQLH